jgi:hypothetical protein
MEDAEDYELEEEQKSYPQYDDMNYHDLVTNFDELTNRMQREVRYGSDPLAVTDLNNELNYVKNLMEERGTAQTTFTEGEDGTVNISGPSGSTTVPIADFVEDPNNLLPDVLDAFGESFNTDWDDIEERLDKLKITTLQRKRDFENSPALSEYKELVRKIGTEQTVEEITDRGPELVTSTMTRVELRNLNL